MLCSRANKFCKLIPPANNAREAAAVDRVSVYMVCSVMNVVHMLNTGNRVQALNSTGLSGPRDAS